MIPAVLSVRLRTLQPLLVFKVAQGALRQVFAEVRGIGARAAVADDEDEAALVVGGLDQLAHLLDLGRIKALYLVTNARQVIGNSQFCTQH